MVFASHVFIFYFLPLFLLVYYLLPRGRNFFILLASYVFYAWWEPWFVFLMLAATIVNYIRVLIVAAIAQARRRAAAVLAVSVVASLGLLAFFKYGVFA